MSDNSDLSKTVVNDQRLDSYKSFFDHSWAERVIDVTRGSSLELIVFDLCAVWRSVANTHVFPWLMVHMFKSFAEGMIASHDPVSRKVVSAIREQLVKEMGDALTNVKKKKLQKALEMMDSRVRAALDESPYKIDINEIWGHLFDKYEMQFALWGSQRLCYAALYYAYEDFLTRCVALSLNKPDYRMPRRPDFTKDVATAFGDESRDYCWSDHDVNVARLVRHSLIHNGGRLSDELRRANPQLQVVNDEIQILAPDTKCLYELLKDRADYLVRFILHRKSAER